MRIDILTFGSYGDVRPYLALARGLTARGHEARLVGPAQYERFTAPAGVKFQSLGPQLDEAEVTRVFAAMSAEPDEKKHPGIVLRLTHDSNMALGESAIETTSGADLIVAHDFSLLGFLAAQKNRIPFVTGHVYPSLIPSSRLWCTGRNFGPALNPLLWKVACRLVARETDGPYNELLQAFGVEPRKNLLMGSSHSPLANLVAISERVVARDPAWPAHYRSTGYWMLREDDFEPDAELRSFVEDGSPPVFVTCGSTYGVDAAHLTRLLVDALADCGRRVVLQAGTAGLGDGELPDHWRRVDFVPYPWLFPRVACVVHHGGAGTMAEALHAGVPQVMTYHLGDQQFWCRHLMRLGMSAGGTAHRRLTAPWLSRAVRRALGDDALRARVAGLGVALRAEDGVGVAVDAIERAAGRG